tara:strand:+ start:209 stop:619 length:411 start_codon:yes stop_codon:yes gene_type:complete
MKTIDPFNRKNKHPFKTPKGYFEAFPTKMQEVILENEVSQTWWQRIKPILEGRFTITSSIAAALVILIVQLSNFSDQSTISEDEAYIYLSELSTDELNDALLLEYVDDLPEVVSEPTEDEILDYLMNQEYIENDIY